MSTQAQSFIDFITKRTPNPDYDNLKIIISALGMNAKSIPGSWTQDDILLLEDYLAKNIIEISSCGLYYSLFVHMIDCKDPHNLNVYAKNNLLKYGQQVCIACGGASTPGGICATSERFNKNLKSCGSYV